MVEKPYRLSSLYVHKLRTCKVNYDRILTSWCDFMSKKPTKSVRIFDHRKRSSRMRVPGNRYEFELKAGRIEISWNFIFSIWILMTFGQNWVGLLSAGLTNFLIFSSRTARIRRDLAKKVKKLFLWIFFEVKNMRQKSIFRILRRIFEYFIRRTSGNLKVLDRD